jgi:hypothetical protein
VNGIKPPQQNTVAQTLPAAIPAVSTPKSKQIK